MIGADLLKREKERIENTRYSMTAEDIKQVHETFKIVLANRKLLPSKPMPNAAYNPWLQLTYHPLYPRTRKGIYVYTEEVILHLQRPKEVLIPVITFKYVNAQEYEMGRPKWNVIPADVRKKQYAKFWKLQEKYMARWVHYLVSAYFGGLYVQRDQ